MQIETWPVNRFVPYFRNPRRNDHAVERMAASINKFGFKILILARSDGEVVDGHLRLKAAQKLNLTEVPVILCDEWNPAQVKAFRLLVNRSVTWADWDPELVALEIQELQGLHFDLELTGFDPPEIDAFLLGDQARNSEDEVPHPGPIVTKPGDQWICGEHRILCGDATREEAVSILLGPAKPALMATDPPYGLELDPSRRERAGLGKLRQTGKVPNDDRADWTEAYKLFAGDVAYVWHAGIYASEVAAGLEAAGFCIRAQIVWAKQHFALSRGDYHWQHEPCWYAVREGKSSNWSGDRTQSTVWQVQNLNPFGGSQEEEATGHGTQKPVELMRRPMLNNSVRGDIVYDPFLGSGTTLIAAESTGRICYGIDIEPRYVDLAVRRWQKQTGQSPVLASNNKSFEQVVVDRYAGVLV